jgi:ParB-like chromosome segregation protein Spo0J
MSDKKYLLIFGYRRFLSFKKLGYLKIPAIIHETDEIKQIPLDEIDLRENTRLRTDDDLSELMGSIKSTGLLQPVKVSTNLNMPMTDFLALNLTENFNRKDYTMLEASDGLFRLKKEGLTNSEISVRTGQPITRIETFLRLIAKTPRKYLKEIRNMTPIEARNKQGKISLAVANAITALRIPDEKKNTERLYKKAKEEELSAGDISIIGELINNGATIEQALENREDYLVKDATFLLKAKEFEKIKMSFQAYMRAVVKKQIPLDTKLFV